ncbi:MAG: alpha/beta hydrolase [bacterium]
MAVDAPAAAEDPLAERPRGLARWAPRHWGLSWTGLLLAVVVFCLSLTPSLLPRPALYMGLIGGLAAATGYALGAFIAWALRRMEVPAPGPTGRRRAWIALAVGAPLMCLVSLFLGWQWQEEVRVLVGEEPAGLSMYVVPVIAVVVFAVLLLIGRGIRGITRLITHTLGRLVPLPLARVVTVVALLLVGWWIASGILPRAFLSTVDSIYAQVNDSTEPGVTPPKSPLRSGSPESLVSWDSLGQTGRTFVAQGPDAAQITAVTGRPAIEPIRVYVGMDSTSTLQDDADLAVAELVRTGAFDRAVLVVAGVTGTGWLEPQSVDAVEYVWSGDTAIVGLQYSFLPSWISFIIDRQRPAEAGQALFDAVYRAWSQLPLQDRPKLIVYGLSLGSYAMQSAFATVGGIENQTNGALFVGTPNFTEPWGTLERQRDPGSPQWKPVYRNGQNARFAPASSGFAEPTAPWRDTRVAFLQHANDPVVWWSYDLIAQEPDWLREPRGPGVSPSMRWIPVVTFLQVTVDQFFGVTVPNGNGHNYPNTIVEAWVLVTQPPDWSPEETARIQAVIDPMPTT